MQTNQVQVQDQSGNPIPGSRALIWGNNAAWLCVACDQLLGNRTGDTEFHVACQRGQAYDILRTFNENGNLNLGPATGVQLSGPFDRSTPDGEAQFRAQQKREEVQQVLAEMPNTVENFIADPKWTKNASNNFVFRGKCPSVTIFINDKGINWYVPGGKHSWGPGNFATIEDAKRDLWRFLKSFRPQGK